MSFLKNLTSLKLKKIEKAHKDEIRCVHVIKDNSSDIQKIMTASMDGFIKMHDIGDGSTKKSFFVC